MWHVHLTTKKENITAFSLFCFISILYWHSRWKLKAFSQNLLQQTGVKGQPDSGAQKPGPLREDSEQDTERLKVNTMCCM